jgi:hypothetical protein
VKKKITRNQRTENNISNILKRLNVIDEFKRIHEYYITGIEWIYESIIKPSIQNVFIV